MVLSCKNPIGDNSQINKADHNIPSFSKILFYNIEKCIFFCKSHFASAILKKYTIYLLYSMNLLDLQNRTVTSRIFCFRMSHFKCKQQELLMPSISTSNITSLTKCLTFLSMSVLRINFASKSRQYPLIDAFHYSHNLST